MYPARRPPPRRASRPSSWAAAGRHAHLRRSSTSARTGWPRRWWAVGPAPRRPRRRSSPRTAPSTSRSVWAAQRSGLYLTHGQPLPDGRGGRLHRERLRGQGAGGLGRAGRRGRRALAALLAGCPVRLAARRGDRRLRAPTRTCWPRTRPSRWPTSPRATSCSTRAAPPGRPKGIKRPAAAASLIDEPAAAQRPLDALFGFGPDTVYLSPAPLYHSGPAGVHARACTALGGTVVVMERFDAEEALAADRAAPGHAQPVGAHDVHPHAEAARRGARPLRPVEPPRGHPRRGALPGRGEAADDRVVGPDPLRVLRRHRGERLHLRRLGHVAGAPGHGRPAGARHAPHLRRRRRRAAGRRGRRRSTSSATGMPFEYHNDPAKTRRPSTRAPDLVDARRRRLRRRRGLPVPHRPQGLHDHLGRREHLPAGDRGRADRAPQGGRRRRVRRARRGDGRAGQGGGAAGRRASTPGPSSSASCWPTAASTWRTTSAPARSTSPTSCPGCPPASSTSACCATATGATKDSRIV